MNVFSKPFKHVMSFETYISLQCDNNWPTVDNFYA